MSSHKKTKGLPPGYTEKNIPGSSYSKPASKDQYDMIHTLLEMPGGKPRPKAKA